MAKIGWGEFIVILIIALLVLGPEKLPQAGRALGKAVRSVKKYIRETTQELEDIEDFKDIRSDVEGIKKDLRSMGTTLERSINDDAEALEKQMESEKEELRRTIESEPAAAAEDKTHQDDEQETTFTEGG